MRERSATLGLAPILPGLVLVLVIVWALAAVLMLTGTLVNAREINDTLPLINNQVSPIDKDLDNVKLAEKTARISGEIKKSAQPLVGKTDEIIVEAKKIDQSAARIFVTAQAINENAKSINGTVNAINTTVSSINGNVVSINDTVNSINSNVLEINDTVDTIGGRVTTINGRVRSIFSLVGPVGATNSSIKGSVRSILGTFRTLEPETRAINSGVAAINRRASGGIVGVRGLKSDFGPIRERVGSPLTGPPAHGTEGPGTIHGHANSIDCAPLINVVGRTRYCNQ